jgi:peptidyl-prolyl cis-trans isomerase SurA
MFVPVFEKVMADTAIGDISEPFNTQFGWHILKVVDRRQEDMSEDMIRNQARNLLQSRRYQEELQSWLQEIRASAYVEVKL